uniref:Protein RALF-like 33 n=1 Tax=Rhizophora mucronata TaxID=61149 RepID=A0A2P2MKQ2_RHIMU
MKCLKFLLVPGILVVLLTLVSPKACVASSNLTTSLGLSMAESDLDLEFMMGSEFGRLLASTSGYDAPLERGPTFACGRAEHYCVPGKNPAGTKEKCNPYKRDC